jgi:hypothetical protein
MEAVDGGLHHRPAASAQRYRQLAGQHRLTCPIDPIHPDPDEGIRRQSIDFPREAVEQGGSSLVKDGLLLHTTQCALL